MPKAPPPARVGRQQADPPPTPDAPARAKTGPRALPLALLVPIDQIEPDPGQPRTDHGAESLAALADSLTEYGVLQPLLVREGAERDDGQVRYIIIAGGRRYAAALLAGLPRLPVVVKDTEGAALRLTQLVENIQRQDLAPLEEARAFKELMDAEGLSAEQLGTRLHISGQKVRDRLLVLGNQPIADAVQRGQMGTAVAAEVLRLPGEGQAQVTAIIDAGGTVDQPTVRALRDDLKAVGVANPRAKGGGRPRKEPPRDRAREPVEEPDYQWSIDIEGVTDSQVDRDEGGRGAGREVLQAVVAPLDATAVEALLAYGEGRGWSCAELARAIRGLRSGEAP
jgi:ParB family chromosome partitioning protein